MQFLSTLPARGATHQHPGMGIIEAFLSTLPARGATLTALRQNRNTKIFLSTLPARGATQSTRRPRPRKRPFLSTLPARGATADFPCSRLKHHISIHAPREGSDRKAIWL